MRLYKEKEIENMNYIFGKEKNNMYFTEFELNLFDKNLKKVEVNV